jgi:hypothetical protein
MRTNDVILDQIRDRKDIVMRTLVIASAMLAFAAIPAAAKSGVKAGVLECDVSSGVGMIIGSSKTVDCTFKGGGRTERYEGQLGKLGIDIGVTDNASMAWVVFAAGDMKKGALAGTYGGASAEATVAVGLGANVLVGGSDKSIALQPVSVKGQTGLNVAAGLASLTLEPTD